MNIDERIAALTMNVELLSHESAKHDEQIARLATIAETALDSINGLERSIDALVQIAQSHERRITQIDGG